MRRATFLLLCSVAALASSPASCATFYGLNGGHPTNYTIANGISGDGNVVVGTQVAGSGDGNALDAFRWSLSGGLVGLGNNPSVAKAASFDGSIVVGTLIGDEWIAFRWNAGSNSVQLIDDLPGGSSSINADAVAYDGHTVVGTGTMALDPADLFGQLTAYVWMPSITRPLGLPAEDSRAHGISGDGKVIVGSYRSGGTLSPTFAFRATPAGAFQSLGSVPSIANDVSSDGSVIVGNHLGVSGHTEPFIWTNDLGIRSLGHLAPDGHFTVGTAVTGDGSIVVGRSEVQTTSEAYIWDSVHLMRPLREVLVNQYGIDLAGWKLTEATDISADGQVIVGNGINPTGRPEAWVANLGPSEFLLFREIFELEETLLNGASSSTWLPLGTPGFDHVGFAIGGKVWEAHPGYAAGVYYDPVNKSPKVITEFRGVQRQHSLASFEWDSKSTDESPTTEFDRIALPRELAIALHEKITPFQNSTFHTPSSEATLPWPVTGVGEILRYLVDMAPNTQKGYSGQGFTCVGLIERAAEEVGQGNPTMPLLRGVEGFVPNAWEFTTISGVTVGTLSPGLLHYVVKNQPLALSSRGIVQAVFDPVEFELIDPLGRRARFTFSEGFVSAIPDTMYGEVENGVVQLAVFSTIPGDYELRLTGVDADAFAAIGGPGSPGTFFSGFLGAAQEQRLQIHVVPEPSFIKWPFILVLSSFVTHVRSSFCHRRT